MPCRRFAIAGWAVATAVLALASVNAAGPGLGSPPTDPSRTGGITAEVDTSACRLPDPACEGSPPGAALAGNENPVKLVLQLQSSRPLDNLRRDAFDVRTQFQPSDAAPVAVASCPACFEAKPGGTYTLWLVPSDGAWKPGGYYLRVGVASSPGLAPALVRVEIPGTVSGPSNRPPTAVIVATPAGQQARERPVIFDGTGSSDPDGGDFITIYKWVITSTNPDADKLNPIILEGPGVSGVSFPTDFSSAFSNVQELTVTLLVTDDPEAPARFASGNSVEYRSHATVAYRVVPVLCSDNTPPVAVIAGAATQQLVGAPGSMVSLLLDGTLSSDPETAIETYTWSCGNGSIPLPQANGIKAVCKYTVDQMTRTYTTTLVVTDRGTGRLVNGQYECAAQSTAASMAVVVAPSAQ